MARRHAGHEKDMIKYGREIYKTRKKK